MLSQPQNTMHWPEEETTPPRDQKYSAALASSWQRWSHWLRVLGVVVPLVGGFSRAFPIQGGIPLLAIFFLPVLIGVVSAGLFRSWWAWLLVPVAFSIGSILGVIFQGAGLPNNLADPAGFVEGMALLVFYVAAPVALGAAIGTPIGMKIEQRLQP